MKTDKNIDIDSYFFGSYLVPFLSSDALVTIIVGRTILGPYKVIAEGLQARLLGLGMFVFAVFIFYVILIKWPESINKKYLKKIFIRKLILSPFFLLWIIASFCYFIFSISNLYYFKYLYIMVLFFDAFFQKKYLMQIRDLAEKIDNA